MCFESSSKKENKMWVCRCLFAPYDILDGIFWNLHGHKIWNKVNQHLSWIQNTVGIIHEMDVSVLLHSPSSCLNSSKCCFWKFGTFFWSLGLLGVMVWQSAVADTADRIPLGLTNSALNRTFNGEVKQEYERIPLVWVSRRILQAPLQEGESCVAVSLPSQKPRLSL